MQSKYLWLLIATTIITGIFSWFSSDHEHNNDFTIPVIICAIVVIACTTFTNLNIIIIALSAGLGIEISLIIKIFIDMHYEPTSHNLFPFEIIINGIVILIVSLVAAAIGYLTRMLKNKIFHKQ